MIISSKILAFLFVRTKHLRAQPATRPCVKNVSATDGLYHRFSTNTLLKRIFLFFVCLPLEEIFSE